MVCSKIKERPDGNLTNDNFAYTWDGENRMIGASTTNMVAGYAYDYMSRRYQKIVDGVTNKFVRSRRVRP